MTVDQNALELHEEHSNSIWHNLIITDLSEAQASVCLASFVGKEKLPTFQMLQLSDDLAVTFRQVALDELERQKKAVEQADSALIAFDADGKPDPHEIEHLSLTRNPALAEQIANLPSVDNGSYCTFKDESFVKGLRFYVIILKLPHVQPIYCFRTYSSKQEIDRSGMIAAMFSKSTFNAIREPIFLFDRKLDAISQGDSMFILQKTYFQRIFRFYEIVFANAGKAAKIITKHLPISNADDFEGACLTSPMMAHKLGVIASKSYVQTVSVELLKFINEKHQLGLKFETQDNKEMLVYEPNKKWEFLKLLNDDYWESEMTGIHYIASGKYPGKHNKTNK